MGRNPDDIKVLFLVTPFLGETDDDARDKFTEHVTSPAFIEFALAKQGSFTDVDFLEIRPGPALPGKLTTNGEQGSLDNSSNSAAARRCATGGGWRHQLVDRTGRNAETVAKRMGE